MRTKLAALLLAVALLCSCSVRVTRTELPAMPQPETQTPAPTPTPTPAAKYTLQQQMYGSAALLTAPTVLVSVFVNDPAHGDTWDETSRAAMRQNVNLAVQWLNEQAQSYGKTLQLYADDGSEDSDLVRSYLLHSSISGGTQSAESSEFFSEMDNLCETLDTAELRAQYGTDKVAFLCFLPISGTSYAVAHYAEDGENFYHEYACFYRYDAYTATTLPATTATFAHEILHLFGAPDLYEGSSDPYVDEALSEYVARVYPNDIMYSTYNADGTGVYDGIRQSVSPLTAYCLGLTDTCAELQQFPLLASVVPGVFRYESKTTAAYAADNAVAA